MTNASVLSALFATFIVATALLFQPLASVPADLGAPTGIGFVF